MIASCAVVVVLQSAPGWTWSGPCGPTYGTDGW